MTRRACGTAAILLLLSLVLPASGQEYLLYTPRPLAPEETPQSKDGVLVRQVPVQSGDTLSRISRRYSGHGSYYPQILLFNDIKNPNLIYAGDTIKVPVTSKQAAEEASKAPVPKHEAARSSRKARRHHARAAAPAKKQHAAFKPASSVSKPAKAASKPAGAPTELSVSELKGLDAGREKARPVQRKAHNGGQKRAKAGHAAAKQVKVSAGGETSSGQRLFEQAMKAFRQEDCRKALDLFDRFLAENASSPQAADASLYKADCYMKLSTQ